MRLDIIVQCIGDEYIKRFCWMLSSIIWQDKHNLDIHIHVANTKEDKLIKTVKMFKEFLKIDAHFYDIESCKDRAYIRRDISNKSNADYILFGDCDMVYSPLFFNKLGLLLQNETDTRCIGTNRYSLDIDYCVDFFHRHSVLKYPRVIDNPTDIVSGFPIKSTKNHIKGVGFFQLVNRQALVKIGGYPLTRNGDRLSRTPSDVKLRKKLSPTGNGRDVKVYNLPIQYHLNHHRNF